MASALAGAAWLVSLAVTGWGSSLPILLFVAILTLGWELVSFPFNFYRNFLLDRKYGLASEPARTWVRDHLKALALGLVLAEIAGLGIYAAMRVAGAAWWLAAAALFAVAGLLLSRVAPVLLLPIFYQFRPLDREALRERLLTLSTRAGVRVLGAFEWGLGEKTSRANAALVGAGGTRRILVSDTLLKDYSDDEIEVILAHEIAHHVHHELWTALALETGVVAGALLAAQLVVTRAGYVPSDPAALPLLVLAAAAVSLLLTPLGTAWSRHNERREIGRAHV